MICSYTICQVKAVLFFDFASTCVLQLGLVILYTLDILLLKGISATGTKSQPKTVFFSSHEVTGLGAICNCTASIAS